MSVECTLCAVAAPNRVPASKDIFSCAAEEPLRVPTSTTKRLTNCEAFHSIICSPAVSFNWNFLSNTEAVGTQPSMIRWIHRMIMARGAHDLPIMATDAVGRDGVPSQVKADPPSMTTYDDATGLARIYRYASRARMWTILILGLSTALCGFALISVQLVPLQQAAWRQTVLVCIIFLITWATFIVASRDDAPTLAWLYSATVVYSAPILLLMGTLTFGGFGGILTLSLLCLPLGIGAWRAWHAKPTFLPTIRPSYSSR